MGPQRPQVLVWVGKLSPYTTAVLYGLCTWYERGGMTNRARSFRYQRPDRALPVETPSRQEGNLKEMQVEYYGTELAQQSLATKHLGGLGWRSRGRQNGRCEKPHHNLVPTDGSTPSLDLPTVTTAHTWAFLLE